MESYSIVIYALIILWSIFSIYYMFKVNADIKKINDYLYDSIPTVYTTLGVLGTFVGIYFGLRTFDVNNIDESIPNLLEGLKTAFSTSIWGISLSLVFGKISQIVLKSAEEKQPLESKDELNILNNIVAILKDSNTNINSGFEKLNDSLIGESSSTILDQFTKLYDGIKNLRSSQDSQIDILKKVEKSLGSDQKTSLLNELQDLRTEQNVNGNATLSKIDWIVSSMNDNNKLISHKFDEFSELLSKNNTEALVEVMKRTTEQFNAQMSELIERLVQENFKELNNSVQKMNQWQEDNKEMIISLTSQFKKVSEEFEVSSIAIKEITENTTKLTKENSSLSKLIQELQKVMIDDTKYQDIIGKLVGTIDTLKENTEAFDVTSNKLKGWVNKQMNFTENVDRLLSRLEEIDKIKDINEMFWKNTKKQLNEGVTIIKNSSDQLSSDLENINAEFYERLNDTLENLDALIQRFIVKHGS